MLNIRAIKGRIKSAKNIRQITKAMELVSAAKMRKAQSLALSGKLYADLIAEMVARLGSTQDISRNPLFRKPELNSQKRIVILITTNKGMCGGLNSNLLRYLIKSTDQWSDATRFVTLGKKGAVFVAKAKRQLQADFSDTPSFISLVPAITELVLDEFLSQKVDYVDIIFNDFISAVKQVPKTRQLLPLTLSFSHTNVQSGHEVKIEPDPKTVFDTLLPHYLENQIRDAILEADASEHSARMIAMRNASDNASSFISDLTLLYNKARQEKITYEIADLVTARLAVES